MEHRAWISAEAALESAAEQAIKRGLVTLGGILDRLSAIEQQDKTSHIRKLLVEREEELRAAARDYNSLVHSLGNPDAADRWQDALATCQQKLSAAYFRLLDDPSQAARLILQAHATACDPLLRQAIEKDRQQITRYTLCREAEALMRADNFSAAEYKLATALASSTESEKEEIRAMQDRCRWGRALRGADTSRANPGLHSVAGTGTRFRGQHNTDAGTQSYETQHWLTLFFLPLFPLGAYRVSDGDHGRYQVHGRLPLSGLHRTLRWVIPIVLCAVIVSLTLTEVRVGAADQTNAMANGVTGPSTRKSIPAAKVPAALAAATPTPVDTPMPDQTPTLQTPMLEPDPARTPESNPTPEAIHTPVPLQNSNLAPPTPPKQKLREMPRPAPALALASTEVLTTSAIAKRRLALDAEGVDLDRQKTYLAAVADSYERENVPQSGRSVYQKLLDDYTAKVEDHKRKVAQLAQLTRNQAQYASER